MRDEDFFSRGGRIGSTKIIWGSSKDAEGPARGDGAFRVQVWIRFSRGVGWGQKLSHRFGNLLIFPNSSENRFSRKSRDRPKSFEDQCFLVPFAFQHTADLHFLLQAIMQFFLNGVVFEQVMFFIFARKPQGRYSPVFIPCRRYDDSANGDDLVEAFRSCLFW